MNFISNLFKGPKAPENSWDKITFKVNLSDRIPQYFESTTAKDVYEEQITPNHPLYAQLFPNQDELGKYEQNFINQMGKQQQLNQDQVMSPHKTRYWKYKVKQNDTMSGLAIRLDISEKYLREINNISGVLYPGMTLKLPKTVDMAVLEKQQAPEQIQKVRISQLLSSQKSSINYKYVVYYMAGLSGSIKGTLTINSNYIIFNPLLEQSENLQKFTIEKLLKFNVLIEMCDIEHAQSMKIPEIDQFSSQGLPMVTWIIQFMLYRVGDNKVQKKYREKIKKLKLEHKALASISFSFLDHENAENLCNQVSDAVNKTIQEYEIQQKQKKSVENQEQNKKRLTNIPFFDIIQQSLKPDKEDIDNKEQNKIIRQSAILGTMTETSGIITEEHFCNLAKGFPMLYKLYNWEKAYSIRRDGSAFSTFLKKTRGVEPAIMLIKEYKGNILGAFLVDAIESGKTGRGEMFIFTFRGESKVPQIYEWTTKNQFFVNMDRQVGIGIGMGIKYGIFVDRTFDKGSSASTNTFGNTDKLSNKEDFLIDEFQIWGVDSSF